MSSTASRNGVVMAVVAVPALLLGTLLAIPLIGATAACGPAAGVSADPAALPSGSVAGYSGEQLTNAAAILASGQALGLGARDQTVAVMVAMGESSLQVIDRGDLAGPDSRGLFQQRDNGAWGSYSDRMDPGISATNFYRAMMRIQNRDSLQPTIIGHRVQANADPQHYTRFWGPAVEVVDAVSGTATGLDPTGASPATGCAAGPAAAGVVSASGWASPGEGPMTSGFGMRVHPVTGVRRIHAGTDLHAGGCGGPIWAAQAGTVIMRGFDRGGNGTIKIDHGGGVITEYLHSYNSGMLVQIGDRVVAGQQIARTGSSGGSTGCHLHFGVRMNGDPVDPVAFMAAVEISLR